VTQSRDELNAWYATPDPWGFQTNPDDADRKARILAAIRRPGPKYKRALDIGCGEGWITQDLPAAVIHGLEWSTTARARIPKPVVAVEAPVGKYDLIVVSGVLYAQYDYRAVHALVAEHAGKGATVLTCHIKDLEQPLPAEAEHVEEFPYREYTQVLRRFRWQ
jgi:hypothetical protein